jgi:2,5-dihydroxypyridine 5,6-dioxygenase
MGVELRSFYGNVMVSIGPNNELGGPDDTPCHFDIPRAGTRCAWTTRSSSTRVS